MPASLRLRQRSRSRTEFFVQARTRYIVSWTTSGVVHKVGFALVGVSPQIGGVVVNYLELEAWVVQVQSGNIHHFVTEINE